ncbi:MAG: NCS1 family nucleobase:cation symporter-1 [Spirochaetes bacterium]|nr:NCS1 family nucleobase:cation symporter-1 [Spirochaetota bacterium]
MKKKTASKHPSRTSKKKPAARRSARRQEKEPVFLEYKPLTPESDPTGIASSPLYSADLAPVPASGRTWSTWSLAALWVGMAVCIPTYMLSSFMIKSGVSWYMSLIIIGLANIIITLPMVLNGHAGVKYGIPFPVFGRSSFGTKGIHAPSIVRGLVACGWFGIQTWIGGLAFYAIWCAVMGKEAERGLSIGKFVGFFLFWLVNMYFIYKGTESIKWLENISAPFLLIFGVALIAWGAVESRGFGVVLKESKQLERPTAKLTADGEDLVLRVEPVKNREGEFKASAYQLTYPSPAKKTVKSAWTPLAGKKANRIVLPADEVDVPALTSGTSKLTIRFRAEKTLPVKPADGKKSYVYSSIITVEKPKNDGESAWDKIWTHLLWLTAMVGFWATMAISIADITRYAPSQKEQIAGQFLGLPGTMILYSFVGIFVTVAATLNFSNVLTSEDAPWDPVTLLNNFKSPVVVVFSQIFMIIATLSTNIAANVIAPAYAFSNALPKKISFRTGGLITGILGIVICPWWLMDEISGLLIFISGLLGPVLGILICDYFSIRKKQLNVSELFRENGIYSYGKSGINSAAITAMVIGIAVALVGYFVPALAFLFKLSWFTGFTTAYFVYYFLAKRMVHRGELRI